MKMRSEAPRSIWSTIHIAFAIAGGLSLASVPAAASSLLVYGSSQASNDPDGQDLVNLTASIGPLSGGAMSSGAATIGSGSALGSASGSADYGVLRVQSSGQASGPF